MPVVRAATANRSINQFIEGSRKVRVPECKNAMVRIDRHCGFSERGYGRSWGLICSSQPTSPEMHASKDLHDRCRECPQWFTETPSLHLKFHVSIKFRVSRCCTIAFYVASLKRMSLGRLARLPRKSDCRCRNQGLLGLSVHAARSLI